MQPTLIFRAIIFRSDKKYPSTPGSKKSRRNKKKFEQEGDFGINYFLLRNCIIIYEHTAAIWLLDGALSTALFFRMG